MKRKRLLGKILVVTSLIILVGMNIFINYYFFSDIPLSVPTIVNVIFISFFIVPTMFLLGKHLWN